MDKFSNKNKKPIINDRSTVVNVLIIICHRKDHISYVNDNDIVDLRNHSDITSLIQQECKSGFEARKSYILS